VGRREYCRKTETDEAKTTLNLPPQQIAPNSNYTGTKLKLKPGKCPSKLQNMRRKAITTHQQPKLKLTRA